MNKKYTYNDMPDKSIEGIKAELKDGLKTAAVFFMQTIGIPLDVFNEMMAENAPTMADQLLWYVNFRNDHPKLYE